MKTLLRTSFAAILATAVSLALPAQTKTIVYGRTTLSSSPLLSYIASFNVTVTDLDGLSAQKNPITFPVKEGVIDLQTGAGEIVNSGGYLLKGNGNSVQIQDIVLDTTTPANPVLTAIFIVNNKLVGRAPLYQAKFPSTLTLPLKPQLGTEQITGVTLTLSKAAATILNNAIIISEPVLQADSAAGTADIYAILAPDNSDE